jgi:hypothetical protein
VTNDPERITQWAYDALHSKPESDSTMLLTDIFTALTNERKYHLRRWGCRQPDGTMAEQPHSTGMFLIYMRDYFDEATHRLSRGPDMLETLGTLRKIVALGLACLEQNDSYDGKPVTLDDLFETIRRSGRMVPLHSRFHVFHVDLNTYLLKIRQCLVDGEVRLAAMNGESGLVIIREIVQIGVECFEKYGVPPRADQEFVFNMRDGRPA